jgi:Subtilase family
MESLIRAKLDAQMPMGLEVKVGMKRPYRFLVLAAAGILLAGLPAVLFNPVFSLAGGSSPFETRLAARMSRLTKAKPPQASQGALPAGEPAVNPKLSSHLRELARSVPQQAGTISQGAPPAAAVLASAHLPKAVRDGLRGRMMRINEAGEVQVYILVTRVSAGNLQALESAGAKIERQDIRMGILQAHIPVTRLDSISALPFVKFVRTPNYAIHFTGSVTTQGDSILKADQVRSLLHLDGAGIKVGVISDGIKGIFATNCTTCGPTTAAISPIASGDLPMATGTRNSNGVLTSVSGGITAKSFLCNTPGETGCGVTAGDLEDIQPGCSFQGAGAEGTAILEIVRDLAPGTQLYFANAATDLDFTHAVSYIGQNADIGIDDVGFVGLPYNGTSDVSEASANALNSSTNPLRGYFTAAGNFAGYHYLSLYTDSGVDGSSITSEAGDLHLFQAVSAADSTADHPATNDVLGLGAQPYDLIELPAGGEAVVVLNWDDPFTNSTNNYDLFLVQESTGQVVARSTNIQSTQNRTQPIEFVDYVNNTGAQDRFHILIQNVPDPNTGEPAAAKHLNMYVFQPECAASGPLTLSRTTLQDHNFNTASESIVAESDAGGSPVSVTSVAAVGATDILTGQPVSDPTTIEPYSSLGPTLDGRLKPDITAVDGVSVTGAGNFENPFFGTSAAAPHAGGIAALLLQAASCLKSGSAGALDPATARQTLRNLVLNNADPLGGAIPNDVYGYGRINALASADLLIPTANASAPQIVSGNISTGASLQLDGSGSKDPTGCPLSYNWSGTCGTVSGTSAMPTVNCPFGTNSESLTVTNNGVTLSQPASVQVTVTDFTIGASPASATVSAGSPASYMITVSPRLGAYSNPIAFSCSNLPAKSACSFSPASLSPGANSASTTLTISTTARSAAPPIPFQPLPGAPAALCLGILLLIVFLIARQRQFRFRAWAPILVGALLAAWLLLTVACGGGSSPSSSSPPAPSGTPAGTYSVSITGTAGSLTHSSGATLVVQ